MYESKELYRTLVEISPDAICVLNKLGEIIFSNYQTAVLYGAGCVEDIIGKNIKNFISPDDYPRAMKNFAKVLQGERIGKNEYCFIKKDGSKIFGETTSSLISIESMSPAILVVARDITERKKFEEALCERDNQIQLIMNSTPALISYIDPNFRYKRVNENYIKWFGLGIENIVGHFVWEVLGQTEWDKSHHNLFEALKGKKINYIEDIFLPNGDHLWLERTYIPDFDESGNVLGIIVHAMDITDRICVEEELRRIKDDLEIRVREQTQELQKSNKKLSNEIAKQHKANEALRESRLRYRTAIDFTYNWEYWIDPEGKYIYVSPSCERISGYSSEEFLRYQELLKRIIHPEDQKLFLNHLEEDRSPKEIEFRVITRSGKECWIQHICQPVYNEQGKFLGRRASNREITEYKRAEKALQAANIYNRNLIETSLDPLVTIGPDGMITDVNTATETVTGFNRKELIGTDFTDYFTEPEKARAGYKQVFEKGFVRDYALDIRHRDGHITPVLYNASVYRDNTGNVIGVFAAARDITELKRAEEDLRKASIYNRSLIEASIDPLVTIGPDGRITDVNSATELVTGFSRVELIGTDFTDYFTEPEKARAGYKQVFEKGFVRDYALDIRHRDGHITPVLYNASVYRDNNGNVIGLFAAARDITELKRAEVELKKYREHLEELVRERTHELEREITVHKQTEQKLAHMASFPEYNLMPIVELDRSGIILYANPSAKQLFPDLVIKGGEHPFVIEWNALLSYFLNKKGQSKTREIKVENAWYLQNIIYSHFNNGIRFYGQNITERKKAEEALRANEEKYRTIVETANEGIWATDAERNTIYMNDRMIEMLGYTRDEITGRSWKDFMDDEGKIISDQKLEKRKEGIQESYEFRLIRKDGSPLWTIVNAKPQFDTNGKFIGVVSMLTDISERKRNEQIIEAALKEKEALLKEIHHRIKNNLQIISSLLNLQANSILDKEALEAFRESQNRIKSMALIHEKLYQSGSLSNINIKEYINDIAAKLFSSYHNVSKNIRLNLKIENVYLEIDKCIAIGLILNELITNSLKHAFTNKEGGELSISCHEGKNKNKLILKVADNGKGLPKNFDYRNAKTLGLQLISSLVEQHDGAIELDNTKGVMVTISLSI